MPPSCLCRFCLRCRFRLFPLRWPLPSPAFAVSVAAAASGFCRFGGRCRLRLLPFRLPLPLPAFAVSVAAAASGFFRSGGRCRFWLLPRRPAAPPSGSSCPIVCPARQTCTARTAKAEPSAPHPGSSGWFRLAVGRGGCGGLAPCVNLSGGNRNPVGRGLRAIGADEAERMG